MRSLAEGRLQPDGSSGVIRPGRLQLTVREGALASFDLDFEGLNESPKVRRVR